MNCFVYIFAWVKQVYFTIINITARFNFSVGNKVFEIVGIPLIYKIVTVGSVTFYIIQYFGTFCIACRQMIQNSFRCIKTCGFAFGRKRIEIVNPICRTDYKRIRQKFLTVYRFVKPRQIKRYIKLAVYT